MAPPQQMAINMANSEALVRKPHVKTAEFEKSHMIKVSNCFKSDFKGFFVLVLPELRKSFRYKVSVSFRNHVPASTVRVCESFYLICVLHACPIPIGAVGLIATYHFDQEEISRQNFKCWP